MTEMELHGDIIEGRVLPPNTSTIYWVPDLANPEAPTAAELAGATKLGGIVSTDFSTRLAIVDEVEEQPLMANYTADLTFKRVIYAGGRGYGKSQRMRERAKEYEESRNSRVADWVDHNLGIQLAPWQRSFMKGLLGSWQETPREELRRRLNNWLRGTYPGEPINWKGLS